MSETISEMILPGTYIEVRSEGLIGVGGISTGNIGIVGTASKGPVGKATILGSYPEALETFGAYDQWDDTLADTRLSLVRGLEQVFRGGASTVYAVRIANGDPAVREWARGGEALKLTAQSAGTWANNVDVSWTVSNEMATLTLELGRVREIYVGGTAEELVDAINAGSRFFVATTDDGTTTAADLDAATLVPVPGSDGANATTTELEEGLRLLATQPVNIVAIPNFSMNEAAAQVLGHLEATENEGRERIAVMGASTNDIQPMIDNDLSKGSNARLVLVAPGIVATDAARTEANRSVTLPASYAAALVAGRMSTLAPHVSLTNKDVAAEDLAVDYTRAEQRRLLTSRVLVLQKNLGIRVLRGITTDTGAFQQISVRRIVDYAKEGTRRGCNPYIGKLNNARVRSALQATIDGFLAGMVLDEMLIAYSLEVSATRAQEIQGQAIVTMTLQPTFSIDFIKVIMNLS